MRGKEGEVILQVSEVHTKRSPQQPGIPLFGKGAGFEIKISGIQFLCVSIQLIITINFFFFFWLILSILKSELVMIIFVETNPTNVSRICKILLILNMFFIPIKASFQTEISALASITLHAFVVNIIIVTRIYINQQTGRRAQTTPS